MKFTVPRIMILSFLLLIMIGATSLTSFSQFDNGDLIEQATRSKVPDFVADLTMAGFPVASSSGEITQLIDELSELPLSERALILTNDVNYELSKVQIATAYQAGILIVALDTPISTLYDAIEVLTPVEGHFGEIVVERSLGDLQAQNFNMVVASMVYYFSNPESVTGYLHTTDYYSSSDALISQIRHMLSDEAYKASEAEAENVSDQSLNNSYRGWPCAVASVSWTNSNQPGTSPTGTASCSNPTPYYIRATGSMDHNCGGWHNVGTLYVEGSSPYLVTSVSGTMTGFPNNNDYCNSNQNGPRNPLEGHANVYATAQQSPNTNYLTDSAFSQRTVYYP